MARYRKLKKVSWAPDAILCQTRQFSTEDCPSKVGLGVDDKLQFKLSHKSQFNFASNNLSPGVSRTSIKKSEKLVSIPSIRWKCPPKVNLNPNWLVASGEQSEEVYLQKQRELKVFEAVYPRLTNIPHSPSGALCKDGHLPDDCITPTIRITPIEDDEVPLESSSEASSKLPAVSVTQPPGFLNTTQRANSVQKPEVGGTQGITSCTEADVGAAASAALTALLKSNEIGSSIDTGILIDIFNNPETVSMLLNMPPSSPSLKPPPKTTSDQVPPSATFSSPSTDVFSSTSASGKWGGPTHCASTSLQPGYVADTPSFRNRSQPNITHEVLSKTPVNDIKPYPSSAPVRPPPQVKDANYYKNLIKQHGLDKQDSHESSCSDYGFTMNGQRLAKNAKPCMFFNTPRGCRKGLECPFRHDITSQATNMTEVPNAKRMKLGRELANMT